MKIRSALLMAFFPTAALGYGCPTVNDAVDDDDTTIDQEDDDDTAQDLDGDGYTEADGDCDDWDPHVHPDATEACDGIDNDCDGEVDEGYVDTDGDGIADCIDGDCDVDDLTAGWHGIVDSCPWSGQPAADPWDIVVEWQWGPVSSMGAGAAPAVANLTDDNGDGQIDERDVPDIVVPLLWDDEIEDGALLALHGDGSGTIFMVPGPFEGSNVLVADIDRDEVPDVVAINRHSMQGVEVVAYEATGTEKWRSEYFYIDWHAYAGLARGAYYNPTPVIGDPDRDGEPEVITQWAIFNGHDGSTELLLDRYFEDWVDYVQPNPSIAFLPTVSDLNRDGSPEFLLEDSTYAADGTHLWDSPLFPENTFSIQSAVADLMGDEDAEVVTIGGQTGLVLDADGTVLHEFMAFTEHPNYQPSRPTIADFNGDGQVDIAAVGTLEIGVFQADGSQTWRSSVRDDQSSMASCSAFDFDLDGAYELVCADELKLRIYDGRTGSVIYRWNDHASGTLSEYPVVADVDGDGSAEIVLACNDVFPTAEGNCTGVAVLGHRHNAWPPAGPVWSVHDYTPFRIRPDGKVEMELVAPWSIHNMFLARPPGDGLAELAPVAGETCLTSCENGPWKVTWGVLNQGWVNVREPIDVAIYRLDGDQATLLEVRQVEDVEYGYQKAGETIELGPDAWGDGLRIVVDDDGTGVGAVVECDEGNNVLEILAPVCP